MGTSMSSVVARLFTGLSLGSQVHGKLETALHLLRPAAELHWSPPENLHITTKFIGEWPESRLPELRTALSGAGPADEFPVSVAGFGYYPDANHPRVLYAGVGDSPALTHLARKIDETLAAIGCAREERPYSPHVTVARINRQDIRQLREQIALMGSMNHLDFGTFIASEFHLYRSAVTPRGSVYTTLATYPLVHAA